MKTIKDMLSRVALFCRLEVAIVAELEKLSQRVYALEEQLKLKDAAIRHLREQLQNHDLVLRQRTPAPAASSSLDAVSV